MKLSKNKIKASNAGGDILGSFFGLGFLLTFFGIVSGLGVLAYQIFFWLKNGEWKNIPMSMLLEKININLQSIYNPTDWAGLAKSIQLFIDMQVGLSLLVPGIIILVISFVCISIFE